MSSRRLLFLTLFVGMQALVALLALEVIGRIFDPIGISYYPETAAYLDTLIHEEPIGYRNRPGLEEEFFGTWISINSLGMRDVEIPETAPPDEFRILVMGDSVPFGVGQEFENTIPQQLEAQLNARSPAPRRVKTLNMGVPSYNTEQELIQLESLGLSLEPDLAILLFSLNDLEDKMWVFEKRASAIADLSQRSYALSILFVIYREIQAAMSGRDARSSHSGEANPRWEQVESLLGRIARICEEASVPFVLITRFGENEVMQQRFAALKERIGIRILDVAPRTDPRWADLSVSDLRNSRVDSHANELGSMAFATLIREGLERMGLLDALQD